MTVYTLQAPMPAITIPGGTVLTLEAIDPTTGNSVAGVALTNVAVYGYDLSSDTTQIEDVIPAYTSDAASTV